MLLVLCCKKTKYSSHQHLSKLKTLDKRVLWHSPSLNEYLYRLSRPSTSHTHEFLCSRYPLCMTSKLLWNLRNKKTHRLVLLLHLVSHILVVRICTHICSHIPSSHSSCSSCKYPQFLTNSSFYQTNSGCNVFLYSKLLDCHQPSRNNLCKINWHHNLHLQCISPPMYRVSSPLEFTRSRMASPRLMLQLFVTLSRKIVHTHLFHRSPKLLNLNILPTFHTHNLILQHQKPSLTWILSRNALECNHHRFHIYHICSIFLPLLLTKKHEVLDHNLDSRWFICNHMSHYLAIQSYQLQT